MKQILVINGPNLNFLGIREKGIYGDDDYKSVCNYIKDSFQGKDLKIEILQSNSEGKIIDLSNIHEREDFRKISVTSPACVKQIYGKGKEGYIEAINFLLNDVIGK